MAGSLAPGGSFLYNWAELTYLAFRVSPTPPRHIVHYLNLTNSGTVGHRGLNTYPSGQVGQAEEKGFLLGSPSTVLEAEKNHLLPQPELQRLKGRSRRKDVPLLSLVASRQRTHPSGLPYPGGQATEAVGEKEFVQGHLVGLNMSLCLLDSEATGTSVLWAWRW